jgi:hypothetical protein
MIEESQEIQIARERLAMLRRRMEEIVTDPDKPRRVKDMELAGLQGMMAQIEAEIRACTAARMREQVEALRRQLQTEGPRVLGQVLGSTLDLVEQLALREA